MDCSSIFFKAIEGKPAIFRLNSDNLSIRIAYSNTQLLYADYTYDKLPKSIKEITPNLNHFHSQMKGLDDPYF